MSSSWSSPWNIKAWSVSDDGIMLMIRKKEKRGVWVILYPAHVYQIEFMNSLCRKCWERSGIFEAVQMVWSDERQFITGCTEVTVSSLFSHSFIKYLLCAQLCQALFQAKGIQLWRSKKKQKTKHKSFPLEQVIWMEGRTSRQKKKQALKWDHA